MSPRKGWDKVNLKDRRRIIELLKAGLPIKTISIRTGFSPKNISKINKEEGARVIQRGGDMKGDFWKN